MGIPKVLVFTTIYSGKDYILDTFIEHCDKLNYPNYKQIYIDNSKGTSYLRKLREKGLTAFHTERGGNSREALARSQNFARNYAIKHDYDYILSLESDILVQKDTIQRLLSHGYDVVSGLYHIGDREKGQRVPCIALPEFDKELHAWGSRLLQRDEWAEYENKGLKQVHTGGFGCCIIYKTVFKKFPFYYDPRFSGHSDIYFFSRCFENKIPVFVDTDIIADHQNSNWLEVEDR